MNVPSLDPVKGHIHVKVSKRILNNFQNPGQIIRSSVEVPSQISHNFHIPSSHSAQPAQAPLSLLADHLAAFKIPDRLWLRSDPLPRGGTDKTDRRALRAQCLAADTEAGAPINEE